MLILGELMKTQHRNILFGIPQIHGRKRVAEVVLSYKIPAVELRPVYLQRVLGKILDAGADILTANRSIIGETVNMTLFIELDETNVSAKEIEKRLKKLEFLSEVSVFEPKLLLFDTTHFPLTNGLERVCIISAKALAQMQEEMTNMLGSGAFAILWRMGLEMGKNFLKIIRSLTSEKKLEKKNMLEAFKQLYQARGWGIIEYVNVNLKQESGKIRIHHSIAENFKRKHNRPICYYTKGCLTAFLEEIFQHKPLHIEETKCMAMGDKFCEFEFR